MHGEGDVTMIQGLFNLWCNIEFFKKIKALGLNPLVLSGLVRLGWFVCFILTSWMIICYYCTSWKWRVIKRFNLFLSILLYYYFLVCYSYIWRISFASFVLDTLNNILVIFISHLVKICYVGSSPQNAIRRFYWPYGNCQLISMKILLQYILPLGIYK